MNQWDDEKPKNKREQYTDPNDYLSQNDKAAQQVSVNVNTGQSRRGCGGCGCIFGLLTVVSFVAIFVFAFGVAFFPAGAAAVSPVFCPSGTTMKTEEGERDFDGTEIFFRCLDVEGQLVEDVTWKFALAMVGLILLPFGFIGLGVLFAARRAVRVAKAFIPLANSAAWTNFDSGTVSINSQTIDLRDKAKRGEINQGDMEQVSQVFRQFFGNDASSPVSNVTERLRELQEAYDAGLVTKEEYDRKRAEILNKL